MRKNVIAAALTVAMVMNLAACGSSSTASTTAAATTAAATEAATTAAATEAAKEETTAAAAEAAKVDFPTENIDFIIPYKAGGDADNIFRSMEPVLSNYLNGNAAVANIVAGGNAIPGTQQMLDSAADGYHIVMVNPGNACIQPSLGNATYAFEDFQAICCLTATPVLLAVAEDAPYATFDEWVTWVKEHPGEFTYCTSSLGGTPHLAMVKLLKALGIYDDVLFVPYSGNAEAYAAVAGGEIMAYASGAAGVIGKEGVRPLINLGTADVEAYPDLIKIADTEAGVENATDVFWGLACSKDVDPAIVEALDAAFKGALEDPTTQEAMKNQNIVANYMPSADFQKYLADSYEAYKVAVDGLDLAQ